MPVTTEKPVLGYPVSDRIHVYQDDGKWDEAGQWFMRRECDLERLYQTTVSLRVDEDGDVDLSMEDWIWIADMLVKDWPGCVFVYTSVEG